MNMVNSMIVKGRIKFNQNKLQYNAINIPLFNPDFLPWMEEVLFIKFFLNFPKKTNFLKRFLKNEATLK